MAPSHALKNSPPLRRAAIAGGGAALLGIVLLASAALAADRGDALTRNTIRLSLAWYTVALTTMMTLSPRDWSATSRAGQFARGAWTWAWAGYVVHLGMAFHYFHRWSHANAFEHTRQASGVGEGLYVSYLFTLVWTADVVFWRLRPERYAERSAWLDRVLHAFMLFMVFNGMIVFETGLVRWAGVVMFAGLLAIWCATRSFAPLRRA